MATGTVGSLFVRLFLDTAEYSKGLTKAEAEAKRFELQTVALGTAIGTQLGNAVVGAGRWLLNFAAQSISAKSALYDMHLQTGIAIDKLDGLRKVGMYSNTTMQEIAGAATRLNRSLAGAGVDGANVAARALKALNLNIDEFRQLNAEEQMVKVAKAMAGFADDTGKATTASLLFKQSGPAFLKFLKELGERGIQSSQETLELAKASKDLEDKMTDLRVQIDNLQIALGNRLVPALTSAIEFAHAAIEAFGGILRALDRLPMAFNPLLSLEENIANTRKKLEEAEKNKGKGPKSVWQWLGLDINIWGDTNPDVLKRDLAFLESLQASKLKRSMAGGPWAGGGPGEAPDIKPSLAGRIPAGGSGSKVNEANRYFESLRQQVLANLDLTETEKARMAIEEGLIGLTAQNRAAIMAAADELDRMTRATKELAAVEKGRSTVIELLGKAYEEVYGGDAEIMAGQARANELDALNKSNAALETEIRLLGLDARQRVDYLNGLDQERIALINTRLETEALTKEIRESLEARREALRDQVRLRTISQDKAEFVEAREVVAKLGEKVDDTLAKSIADGIMEGFMNGQTFVDVFLNLLKAKFAEAVLTPIISPIVKTGQDLIGQLMQGVIAGITGYSDPTHGGVTGGAPRIGMTAGGGPVGAGGMYRINELRTEALTVNGEKFLLMGNQGGTVDSNPRFGRGNVTQINNIGQGVSRNEVASALFASHQMLRAEMRRSQTLGQFAGG